MESRKMRPTRKSSDYSRYVQELQLSLYNKRYNDTSNRIYEEVDFSEKDLAKSCGARWDSYYKKWYFLNEEDHDTFLFN
jgi:hypothetical protein